jgi:hypothetical protein
MHKHKLTISKPKGINVENISLKFSVFALFVTGVLISAGCSDKGPVAVVSPTTAKPAVVGVELAPKNAFSGLDVTLKSKTGVVIKSKADEQGRYAVPDLAKGEYDLLVSSGEQGHITHNGGPWEGKVTVATPAVGNKKIP